MIELLAKHTAIYASQSGNHKFSLSNDEMRVFIGILLLSGYCTVPRRRLYWSYEQDTHNEMVSKSMRRSRFEEIMKYFHAANNADLIIEDKFAKIRPLLEIINKNFLEYGVVFKESNISMDESMIPYHGRHPTKQFIRGKPIRWGYKGWVATSPSGYAFFIDLYQGKYDKNPSNYKMQFGIGGSVVLNSLDILERNFPKRKFCLYFDHFFTSLASLEEIHNRGHNATCMIRSIRIDIKKFHKLPRGSEEHHLDLNSNILVIRWSDNGIVNIASNCHGLKPAKKVSRWSASERRKTMVSMPNAIDSYNRHMGGVHRLD